MFRIKLLILSLYSLFLLGCVTSFIEDKRFNVSNVADDKFFLYENTIIQYLSSMGLYDNLNYEYLITISPNKSEGVFITNIDKNSDRKRISLDVTYTVAKKYYNTNLMCNIFVQNYNRSSSYIIASGEFNTSNRAADEEILNNLIDIITNDFIDDLSYVDNKECKYKFVRER